MNEFKIKKGLIVQGSGSTLLDIQGSQGQLFSVTDDLSGSLFSVNDISGIPIMEVFSDDRVNLGTFNAEAIKVSGSTASITGSLFGTASFAQTASFAISASFTQTAATASVLNGFDPNAATFTIELIDALTVDFYAPDDLRINTTSSISGSVTASLSVNNSAYTLTNLINQGNKITVTAASASVFNLNARYE